MLKPTLVTILALDGRCEDELLALATGAAAVGHSVVVGDEARFAQLGLSVEALGEWPLRLRQQGQQVVFVAVDGRTVGLLGVVDASA